MFKFTTQNKMDLATIIMGIVFISAGVIPIALSVASRNKAKKQLTASLNGYAEQNNCTIEQHEVCGNYIIGIDKNKGHLFFELRKENKIIQQCLNLATIRECKALKQCRSIKDYGHVIDRLALSFMPKNINDKCPELEFYDSEVNSQLVGELQSLESWHTIINKTIASI